MASPRRRIRSDLIQRLDQAPYRFEFFQAVKLLTAATDVQTSASSADELQRKLMKAVRFRSVNSLAFPASELQKLIRFPADEENKVPPPPDLLLNFMGLTGPQGVLPAHYTELLQERSLLHRDHTAGAFFDLFHQRILSLFYAAWDKYRFYLRFERGDRESFTRNLLDLVGMGSESLRKSLGTDTGGMPEDVLVYYAGLLGQKPISASAMANMLQDYFATPFSVSQFQGQWILVNKADQTQLGQLGCELGETAFLGDRMWDQQTKFRLVAGPMKLEIFQQFMPGQNAHSALRKMVDFCVGSGLDYDLQLILDRSDIQPAQLSGKSELQGTRLGWMGWLQSQPPAAHASEVVVSMQAA